MMLFHVLRHMNGLKPQFDKTLEGCDPSVRWEAHAYLSNSFPDPDPHVFGPPGSGSSSKEKGKNVLVLKN
jgi:hypothetical protein